jgi:hypothetical protein
MKKLGFLLILGGVFISSCKKDYTCTCTTSTTVLGVTTSVQSVYIIPGATQPQAATICVAHQEYSQGGSQTTKCNL